MNDKKHAIVCLPADTIGGALRMKNLGEVDVEKLKLQHKTYLDALVELGFGLITMPKNNFFPDSVFVEDPAIIMGDVLVVTRLRRKERQGEEPLLKKSLEKFFSKIFYIKDPGFVEGGDVLVTDKKLYIGLSNRTNFEGAEQLVKIARDECGYTSKIFEIPENWLHLKGGASFQYTKKDRYIIVSEEIKEGFYDFVGRLIVVPGEERFGANCISNSDNKILVHAGCPKTSKILKRVGFDVCEIDLSEFAKIDGAMTCLSKLF